MTDNKPIDETTGFTPKFNSHGLITAIAQDEKTNQVLMVGYMNKQALDMTIETGIATYYSRSRKKLWKKGEQSGHFQKVQKILIDCDQDCILLKVNIDAGQCHTGYQSCFYREITTDGKELKFIAEKTYNPDDVYK